MWTSGPSNLYSDQQEVPIFDGIVKNKTEMVWFAQYVAQSRYKIMVSQHCSSPCQCFKLNFRMLMFKFSLQDFWTCVKPEST